MANSRKKGASPRSDGPVTENAWSPLTWEEIELWAGPRSASRGKTYQRRGRVTDLAVSDDGKLLATVMGSGAYMTMAWLSAAGRRSRSIESKCTCPVGNSGCKHAVAVVLAYLDSLADGKETPIANSNDRRWAKLTKESGSDDDDFGSNFDDEADDEFDQTVTKRRTRKHLSSAGGDEKIVSYVRAKRPEELAELVCTLIRRFPELRVEFQEQIALAEGDVQKLVNQARRELRKVTEEVGWRNHWDHEGHTPNYSGLKHKLERLVAGGHHDEVVKLGEELIRRGINQVAQAQDEGETGMEFSGCLPVVFDALMKSSRTAPDKLLYVIDAFLQDDYDLIGDAADPILDGTWTTADWSEVADRLAKRLKNTPGGTSADDFTRNFQRDRLSGWLLDALDHAGRQEDALDIYESEARKTGSYQRLVEFLMRQGRLKDAERWGHEGIVKTQVKWPGIADALRKKLCELAQRRKDWGVVAAHAARDFFERPSVSGFRELVAAAERAKCEAPVRAAALAFLESGKPPTQGLAGRNGQARTQVNASWPLPMPDYLAAPPAEKSPPGTAPRRWLESAPRPYYDVLLQMAIAENNADEVLRWYDKMGDFEKGSSFATRAWGWNGPSAYSDQVANAVASTHPERALQIYRRKLDEHLNIAQTSAYENCATYLRKMRPIMNSLGRDDEWARLLADIRHNYRNRPRFMEVLEALDGRTILQARKARNS